MAKFVERDQSQLYLLPVDMRDWVPEDDLSHFVVGSGGSGADVGVRGERARNGVGPIPPADDAGAVGVLLRQRDIRFAANRAGNIPGHWGSICGVELSPGPRHHLRVSAQQLRGGGEGV